MDEKQNKTKTRKQISFDNLNSMLEDIDIEPKNLQELFREKSILQFDQKLQL